jgi:hypothetical protein
VSESALEHRYRRLLAWYPAAFRHEQEDEMLAVLMAGARPGQRRLALAASAGTAGCWVAGLYLVPELLQVLSASVFLLAGATLIDSPGPRRGRQLLTWRYGAVLLLAAAAVQVSTVMYDAMSPFTQILTRTCSG